ncbi:unnamed protein product, partial [Meganyctiphanes norvegica]
STQQQQHHHHHHHHQQQNVPTTVESMMGISRVTTNGPVHFVKQESKRDSATRQLLPSVDNVIALSRGTNSPLQLVKSDPDSDSLHLIKNEPDLNLAGPENLSVTGSIATVNHANDLLSQAFTVMRDHDVVSNCVDLNTCEIISSNE